MATSVTTKTPYGFSINVGQKASGQTFIHKMANYMWLPMLAMGVMVVAGAFVVGAVQAQLASDAFDQMTAVRRANLETIETLQPGIIFLGVAFLLSGISFLLASVLGAMRWGGGEIQEKHAGEVHTPRMPVSAWAFLILMMTGLMVELGTLGLHIYAAVQIHDYYITGVPPAADATHLLGRAQTVLAYAAPLRMVGIGFLLAGIVAALYTIGNVLRFQFDRITAIILNRSDTPAGYGS